MGHMPAHRHESAFATGTRKPRYAAGIDGNGDRETRPGALSKGQSPDELRACDHTREHLAYALADCLCD